MRRRQASASVRPSRPVTLPRDRQVGDVEAGAEDDRVDRVLDAVGGDDARPGATSVIGSVTTSTFGRVSAGQVVVGEQHPLAAHARSRA